MSKHLQQLFLELGLQRIAAVLDDELGRAAAEATPVTELLQRLLSLENDARTERRAERRIKEAKLPDRKLLADFDFDFQKNIDKRQIMDLATLEFAKRKQGLVFAGNSGTGKSHIAKALLLIGCRQNYRCRYVTAATMLKELLAGLVRRSPDKDDASFHHLLEVLCENIDDMDRRIIDLLAERMRVARQIGQVKKDNNITILQYSRWNEILQDRLSYAGPKGISADIMTEILQNIHKESIRHQAEVMNTADA